MHPITALRSGAAATWFRAQGTPQQKRKAWIAGMKPKGRIVVDQGAVRAMQSGSSLLPAGVTGVDGHFGRGDPVEIIGPDGHQLGLGLTRYTAEDARAIKGLRSGAIEPVLGYPARAALIHRDDMAF